LFRRIAAFAMSGSGYRTVWSYFESPVKEYVVAMSLVFNQWELTPSLHGADVAYCNSMSQSSGHSLVFSDTVRDRFYVSQEGGVKILPKFWDTKFWQNFVNTLQDFEKI
jgi:hypothetical protein